MYKSHWFRSDSVSTAEAPTQLLVAGIDAVDRDKRGQLSCQSGDGYILDIENMQLQVGGETEAAALINNSCTKNDYEKGKCHTVKIAA